MQFKVKSWDVFDTLVARRCVLPNAVFDMMGERLGIADFTRIRKDAEHTSADRTLRGIYANLEERTGWSSDVCRELMDAEIAMEGEQLFLIPEIYEQIQDGDLLLSDMYLDADTIGALLRRVGFRKNVKIISTYGGKAQGSVWPWLAENGFSITEHTGDNHHSDVLSPSQHGIASRHYSRAQPTVLENFVATHQFPRLARLMRTVRLRNPFRPASIQHDLWNEQAQLNAAILYLSSLHLHHFVMPRNNLETMLFATRDCVHWHKIHAAMFPSDKVVSFETSRTMLYQPTPHYLNYVRSFGDPARMGFVDVFGTGNSTWDFFSKYMPAMPFYYVISGASGAIPFNENWLKSGRAQAVTFDVKSSAIEQLNYDLVGTLVDFKEHGGIRMPQLNGFGSITVYHMAMRCFMQELSRSKLDATSGIDTVSSEEALLAVLVELNRIVDGGVLMSALVPHDPNWFRVQRPLPENVRSSA